MEDATIVSGTESLNRSGSSQKPVTDQAARNLGLSRSGRRDEAKAFGVGRRPVALRFPIFLLQRPIPSAPRATRICSPPWVPSRGCGSCACSCPLTARGWWSVRSARSSKSPLFASPRQAEERRTGHRASRRHLPLVHGELQQPRGAPWFSLCRVLCAHQTVEPHNIVCVASRRPND